MNDYINSKELQQMKEQLAILTRKLDKEAIINERLIRRAMKNKASFLRRFAIIESVILIVMLPYFIWVMPNLIGISTALCYFTCFFMILALGHNYYIHSHFRPEKFIRGNLLEARRDTLMLKKYYANWLKYIGIPFILVFLSWYTYDTSRLYQGEELQTILTGLFLGSILGGIIGIHQYRKIQRTADDILSQIEELEEK